jgi:hypothetical protein
MVVTIGVSVLSITMVIAPNISRQLFSLALYSSAKSIDSFDAPAIAYINLVHAILGALMLSWGIVLFMLASRSFHDNSRESWRVMMIALLAWFIPDSAFSLWSGFWQNAALNLVVALLIAIPLAKTYPILFKRTG